MKKTISLLTLALCLSACTAFPAERPPLLNPNTDITLTPNLKSPGTPISEEFIGLSYETRKLLPDNNNRYYFHPDTPQLVPLFKSLGIKSLRIGGNTADRDTVNIPTNRDLDALYAFAQAADVKIIYNLRLKNTTDPADDIRIVKHIMTSYSSLTTCFTLGNEPDFYFKDFPAYFAQYKKFSDAILKEVPDAKFCGPSTAGHQEWAISMADKVPSELAFVSLHTYPGGNAQAAGSPPAARAHILSPDMEAFYEKYYNNFAPAVAKHGLSFRLEECNSLYNGGASNISNSFASAIWALDFMYWYASHGAVGVNFHTGTTPNPGDSHVPGGYDAFWTSPTGLRLHPISYALKAFDIAAHGKIIPLTITTTLKDSPNLTAYAVLNGNDLYLTIMNRQSAPTLKDFTITINSGPYNHAQILPLFAPKNDAAALEGITLGNAPINGDGTWKGTWTPLPPSDHRGQFTLIIPATSAIILKLTK